jgi:hypothetical protein
MTILSVVQQVCATVGVLRPTSVFASIAGNRTMQEMLECANEMAQRIATDYREWGQLKTSVTYPGDGVTEAFALPANYRRMLLTTNVWLSSNPNSPMRFIPSTDEWMQRRAAGDISPAGEWTLYGGQIHIHPVMPIGVSARFAYLDRYCVSLTGGGFGEVFQLDTDTFRLDERILKLGMIWDWKAKKGSPYAEDMGTYSDALVVALGSDGPAPILIGQAPISHSLWRDAGWLQ